MSKINYNIILKKIADSYDAKFWRKKPISMLMPKSKKHDEFIEEIEEEKSGKDKPKTTPMPKAEIHKKIHYATKAIDVFYKLAEKCLEDGLADKMNVKPSDVKKKELSMGIEVEKEHTPNMDQRKQISLDHLSEIPNYYTRLDKLEEEAKKDGDFNEEAEKLLKNKKRS